MPESRIELYLLPGPTQDKLLNAMDKGHARERHGSQFGDPTSARFKALIRAHLQQAPEVYLGESARGHRAYLFADPRTDQVLWIAPLKPHRATIFHPDHGVRRFVADRRRAYGADLWHPVNLDGVRGAVGRDVNRTTVRAITSAARTTNRSSPARVP